MDYVKVMAGHGIKMNSLSDYELKLLELAMEQEKSRREAEREREREQHMHLIAAYTDELNKFIAKLNEDGFVLEYDDYEDEFIIKEGE